MSEDNIKRGFLVNENFIPQLLALSPRVRNLVLGCAFEHCFGIENSLKIKDEYGVLTALVASIVQKAQEFDQKKQRKRELDANRNKKNRQNERTRTDANGRERTKADANGCESSEFASALEENRIEEKGIEENISPKSPSAEGDLVEENSFLAVLKRVAKSMHENHPSRAGDLSMVERALRTVCPRDLKNAARLESIADMHAKWVASGIWQKAGGRFTPRLDKWIVDGGWQDEPREFVEEADDDTGDYDITHSRYETVGEVV